VPVDKRRRKLAYSLLLTLSTLCQLCFHFRLVGNNRTLLWSWKPVLARMSPSAKRHTLPTTSSPTNFGKCVDMCVRATGAVPLTSSTRTHVGSWCPTSEQGPRASWGFSTQRNPSLNTSNTLHWPASRSALPSLTIEAETIQSKTQPRAESCSSARRRSLLDETTPTYETQRWNLEKEALRTVTGDMLTLKGLLSWVCALTCSD
jgi:hypothetical protein